MVSRRLHRVRGRIEECRFGVDVGVDEGLRINPVDVVAVGRPGTVVSIGSHASIDGSIQCIQPPSPNNPRRGISVLLLGPDQGSTLGHSEHSDKHRVAGRGRDSRGDSLDSAGGDQIALRFGGSDRDGVLDGVGGSPTSLLHRLRRSGWVEDILFVHYS